MGETKATSLHPYVRAERALGDIRFKDVGPDVIALVRNLYGIIDRLERKNKNLQNFKNLAEWGE
jgi:hypothetical protein